MAQFEQLSGLAGDIRSTITSEQFDLGGYNELRARDLIISAFSSPLTAPTEMIKITFVVGGGKLVRSRYPEDLPKWLVAALREIGFTEDRSAAETFDSQGTFKQQHDTGQNLKYLIVFPHISCSKSATNGTKADSEAEPALDEKSPDYIVMACEKATLIDIVESKVTSYNQKKRLLKLLQEKAEHYKAIEGKLVSGVMLNPKEQAFYDANSGSDDEKIAWLQNELKAMIESGQLTAREKSELLKQMENNLSTVTSEIESAKTEGKPKKAEKAEAKRETILSRKMVVEKISPIPPRLKNGDQIRKLYMKVFPLQALEEKGRSMSLTLADLKLLEEKMDIESEIKSFEQSSRGWFEDDEEFTERCQYEEKEARATFKQKMSEQKKSGNNGGKSSSSTIAKSNSSNAWSTIGKKSSGTSGLGVKPAAKKATSAFAAAFDGSDSD
jgi:hypothetical protein